MNARALGFFSGFPDRRFTDEIIQTLYKVLTVRKSLVFIRARPDDYIQNDDDSDGMHMMFYECGLPFEHHYVIDRRTDAS